MTLIFCFQTFVMTENNIHKVDVDAEETPIIASVANFLSGIEFPVDKKAIINYVENNKEQANDYTEILNVLHQLPDRQYQTMADITQAIERQ